MAVNSTTSFTGPYTANGVTTVFAFDFNAMSDAEVQVTRDGAVVDPSLYTVTRGDDGSGSVTFLTAPAASEIFVISNPDFEETVAFDRYGPYFPDLINAPLYRAAARSVYLAGMAHRAVLVPKGEAGFELPNSMSADALVALADNVGDINLIADNIVPIGIVATNLAGSNTVGTVATNIANVNAVGGSITNVNAVAGSLTNINAVAGNAANINAVAGAVTNINNVALNLTNINAVATDLALGAGSFILRAPQAAIDANFYAGAATAAAQSASTPATLVAIIGALGAYPAFTSLDVEGWKATVAAPTELSYLPVKVLRQGFVNAVPVSVVDTYYMTKRVEVPNSRTLTTNQVALSDDVYITDALLGVTNASTEVSPKPNADWIMRGRLLVGNSVHWEIHATHRDARGGKQVDCVRVRGNDGTTQTPWQVVNSVTLSTYCEDAYAVEAYIGDLDVTTLATGKIWLEAEVYPIIGALASVRKTSDFSTPKEFSVRYFYKDVARLAAKPYAYVASTGNDSTGVIHQTAATAAASPFLTVMGALSKVHAQAAQSGDLADGMEIRIVDTVTLGSVLTTTYVPQILADVTITRAPGTARGAAIVTSTAASRTQLGTNHTLDASMNNEGSLTFYDVSVQRSYSGTIFSASSYNAGTETPGVRLNWHNVNWYNSNYSGTWLAGNVMHDGIFGMAFTGIVVNSYVFGISGGASEHRILRGLVGDLNGGSWDAYLCIGSQLTRAGTTAFVTPDKGCVIHASSTLKTTNNVIVINASANNVTLTRLSFTNYVNEPIGAVNVYGGLLICNGAGNTLGAIYQHLTIPGAGQYNRTNADYCGFATTPVNTNQTHRLVRRTGCIFGQYNTKGDLFQNNATLTGYFPTNHGVGLQGNYSMYSANSPTGEHPRFFGIGSSLGTSSTVLLNDPLFTNYQGSTMVAGVLTAGAGGSDLSLQSGSPCKGIVTTPVFKYDIAGTLRGLGAQAAGAYA